MKTAARRPDAAEEKPVPPAEKKAPAAASAQLMTMVGPAVFALSLVGATSGVEPFRTWFFCFAWWSYILFVDGCVHRRRGESLMLSHPGRFLFFSIFSVGMWMVFEALNLRLGNWSYQGLPAETPLRWAGYVLGFATVVPALMETADFLETSAFLDDGHVKPLGWKKSFSTPFLAGGAGALALALLWPGLFFPLVWVAFIFLAEPLNEKLGAPSLLTDWREGSVRRVRVLLLAGFLCGVLWEAFNMPAGARWVYHLPGLDRFKVFEMPLPGYLGFPAFALEAFALTSLALALWDKASTPVRGALLAGWAGFIYFMCGYIDRFTGGLS